MADTFIITKNEQSLYLHKSLLDSVWTVCGFFATSIGQHQLEWRSSSQGHRLSLWLLHYPV